MKYALALFLMLSIPSFAGERHRPPEDPPPIVIDPIQPEPAQQNQYKEERRWCRRDGLRGLVCAGVVLFGGYAIYSWDAKKDEQIKFGIQVKPGER